MKITLTIEDVIGGGVRAVLDPPAEMLLDKVNAGYDLTSAEGYAMLAVRAIREESKKRGPIKVLVPRKGKE